MNKSEILNSVENTGQVFTVFARYNNNDVQNSENMRYIRFLYSPIKDEVRDMRDDSDFSKFQHLPQETLRAISAFLNLSPIPENTGRENLYEMHVYEEDLEQFRKLL